MFYVFITHTTVKYKCSFSNFTVHCHDCLCQYADHSCIFATWVGQLIDDLLVCTLKPSASRPVVLAGHNTRYALAVHTSCRTCTPVVVTGLSIAPADPSASSSTSSLQGLPCHLTSGQSALHDHSAQHHRTICYF